MLKTVDIGERSLSAYRGIAPRETLDELAELAGELRGARVLHLNATPYGGGVSELLRSLVPLLNDLGLVADWKIITGDQRFFEVTKTIHNGLQGSERSLTEQERTTYRATSELNASLLEESYDFVFVHDPQPAAILPLRGKDSARWVWRCHIDTAKPNPEVWQFLQGFLTDYDAAVFTMAEFIPPTLPLERVDVVPPAIDPLSPKNRPLDEETAREILAWIGVALDRPLVSQVSRFDPWKDPLGVIAAYRLAREQAPDLQLALVGSMALDDPEGWEIYEQITSEIAGDPLIHVFTNLTGVGNIEVNAFQRLSSVVLQKALEKEHKVQKLVLLTLVLIAAVLPIAVAGCGDEDDPGSSGRPTDRAFAAEMIPHHEGAIEMAQIAQERGERPEIRRLARSIITSQREEIVVLRSIQSDLRKDGGVVGDLGLSEEHMAKEGDVDQLHAASDFDREFIQMMIPHHGGAIDMAAVELRNGQDPRLKRIARSIIEAQQREIQQMEGWFADWYGEEPRHESSGEHGG